MNKTLIEALNKVEEKKKDKEESLTFCGNFKMKMKQRRLVAIMINLKQGSINVVSTSSNFISMC